MNNLQESSCAAIGGTSQQRALACPQHPRSNIRGAGAVVNSRSIRRGLGTILLAGAIFASPSYGMLLPEPVRETPYVQSHNGAHEHRIRDAAETKSQDPLQYESLRDMILQYASGVAQALVTYVQQIKSNIPTTSNIPSTKQEHLSLDDVCTVTPMTNQYRLTKNQRNKYAFALDPCNPFEDQELTSWYRTRVPK